MNLTEVCDIIALPAAVKDAVLARRDLPELRQAERHKRLLEARSDWPQAIPAITADLGDDPDGMRMLTFMLLRAVETHARYRAHGLSDTIFADTMAFCTRFVNDHFEHYGSYAFRWGWWMPRQVAFQEFRLGALEYELVEIEGARFISIHIPADAKLNPAALQQSYQLARTSIARIAPDFAGAEMQCDSWMLSPVLETLLPAHSNILWFQKSFELLSVNPDSPHAVRWIYGRDDLQPSAFAERTSLQKKTKALMLAGGNIGAAVGRLRDHPWTAEGYAGR